MSFKRNIPGWERAVRAALGIAFTTQCAYCIDTHTRQALEAGASKEEIAEAAFVAAAVRAGGTLAHALLSLRLAGQSTA